MHQKSDVTFYVFPGTNLLPTASPFCNKVIWAARLKELNPVLVTVGAKIPVENRNGKLPVAVIGGQIIEDSSLILKKLNELKPNILPLFPTDPRKKALNQILEDWSDEYLYRFPLHERWVTEQGYRNFLSRLPVPLIAKIVAFPFVRKGELKKLQTFSFLNVSAAERRTAFSDALVSLSALLAESPFLADSSLRSADLAVFSIFAQIAADNMDLYSECFQNSPLVCKWMDEVAQVVQVDVRNLSPIFQISGALEAIAS